MAKAGLTANTRVGLLSGSDVFLRDEHTAALKRALEKEHGQIDVARFDGSTAPVADVLDECRSFGLMAGYKLVIVDEADQLAGAEERREAMIRYVENAGDAATLLLRAPKFLKSKLRDAIEKHGVLIDCSPPDESKAAIWIAKRAKQRHGAEMAPEAARMLVAAHGADLGKLDAEAGKLATAAGDGGAITPDLVAQLGGGAREISPFAIQGALLSGNAAYAIHAVRDVLDNAPRDAHVPLGIAAMQAAAKLHEQAATGRPAKSWGELGDALSRARGRLSVDEAKRLFDLAIQADVNGKSGVGEPDRNLEILAAEFSRALSGR
ncbi:MAG: DNA polymerase III subunit delta [Phycisphaerae bacterium]|nr:DNA polymerase III subunit delta [Phycisphaerae bacterium]